MHKVTPFLWFDNNGEEAMNFYVSLFPKSKVLDRSAWGEGGPVPPGGMMVGDFELEGQRVLSTQWRAAFQAERVVFVLGGVQGSG